MREIVVILGLLVGCLAYGMQVALDTDAETDSLSAVVAIPWFEQTLTLLRDPETLAVVPLKPDAHPVTAAYNREAIIPPQCYTDTAGQYNPCYVCHQNPVAGRENTIADGELQLTYSFSELGMTNHWRNLFEDRSARIGKISDQSINAWVAQDNYSELPPRLHKAGFKGWIPDLDNLHLGAGAFDATGFAKDGSHWVAFNYKPLPSTFWPTNGSTDDVMIRLAEPFRTTQTGEYSVDVYRANLAILEVMLKGLERVDSLRIDETAVGADLDNDGSLSIAHEIVAPRAWVGAAAPLFFDSHSYPLETEFLHTVRYLSVDKHGEVGPSRRMKEVRYMRKAGTFTKGELSRLYQLERMEKELGNLPGYTRLDDHGLDNGMGWAIAGFIEGRDGRLRAYTFEENLACMGCHTSIGATIDKTFSFPRKVDGAAGWRYLELRGMPDAPNHGETEGEILTYLRRVGGGGEFRSNPEMQARWFKQDGRVNTSAVLSQDVYGLITPSAERALELNKAYRVIVDDQDYLFGRDATGTPPVNVFRRIDNSTAPTLPADKHFPWDIRLDWRAANSHAAN